VHFIGQEAIRKLRSTSSGGHVAEAPAATSFLRPAGTVPPYAASPAAASARSVPGSPVRLAGGANGVASCSALRTFNSRGHAGIGHAAPVVAHRVGQRVPRQ
jgi:hypothetical protein